MCSITWPFVFLTGDTGGAVDALQLDVTGLAGVVEQVEYVHPPTPTDEAIDVPQAFELGELLLYRPPAVLDGLDDIVDGELGAGAEVGENLVADSLDRLATQQRNPAEEALSIDLPDIKAEANEMEAADIADKPLDADSEIEDDIDERIREELEDIGEVTGRQNGTDND